MQKLKLKVGGEPVAGSNLEILSYCGVLITGRKIPMSVIAQPVRMPCCGAVFKFTVQSFPLKTLPCPCGKPRYFVVRFQEDI